MVKHISKPVSNFKVLKKRIIIITHYISPGSCHFEKITSVVDGSQANNLRSINDKIRLSSTPDPAMVPPFIDKRRYLVGGCRYCTYGYYKLSEVIQVSILVYVAVN